MNKDKLKKQTCQTEITQPSYSYERLCQFVLSHDKPVTSYTEKFLASVVGCGPRHIRKLKVRLKDDPRFQVSAPLKKPNSHLNYTTKIKVVNKFVSSLSEYGLQRKSNKSINRNIINFSLNINIKSLSSRMPPKTEGLLKKEKVTKIPKREMQRRKSSLILDVGKKFNMNLAKETLKLHAYDHEVLVYGVSELYRSSRLYNARPGRIRSPFRFLRAICDRESERRGKKPNFRLYFIELDRHGIKKPQPRLRATPSPRPTYEENETNIVADYMTKEEFIQKSNEIKTQIETPELFALLEHFENQKKEEKKILDNEIAKWNYPFPEMPDFFGFWLDTYDEKLELWAASYGYFKPRVI